MKITFINKIREFFGLKKINPLDEKHVEISSTSPRSQTVGEVIGDSLWFENAKREAQLREKFGDKKLNDLME